MLRKVVIITLALAAVAIVTLTLRRGPRVVATSTPMPWGPREQRTMTALLHIEDRLSFSRRLKTDDRDSAALIESGDRQVALEGMHSFLMVKRFDQRLWAIAEARFPNPDFDVLVSEDGGESFVRHTAPRPARDAMLIGAEVREREITLTFSTSPDNELADAWSWPWMKSLPRALKLNTGATFIEIRSRDAGHVWQRPWR
ncbi:MAG: hypothetical protein JNM17_19715 [Archangium sp.]|nr:hypothetical protein [Archangium sp.]